MCAKHYHFSYNVLLKVWAPSSYSYFLGRGLGSHIHFYEKKEFAYRKKPFSRKCSLSEVCLQVLGIWLCTELCICGSGGSVTTFTLTYSNTVLWQCRRKSWSLWRRVEIPVPTKKAVQMRWIYLDLNIIVIFSPDPQKYWITLMKFIIVRFKDYFLHVRLLATAIFFCLAEYMLI